MNKHFDQKPRRKAEFVTPPNRLKAKVGAGGLPEAVLDKAQAGLDSNTVDFRPEGEQCLKDLQQAVETARAARGTDIVDQEAMINLIMFPALQLKSNGAMFHYPLVTVIADSLVQFLEVIERADEDACDVIMAFHKSLKIALTGKGLEQGGPAARALLNELESACSRYFTRYGIDRNAE